MQVTENAEYSLWGNDSLYILLLFLLSFALIIFITFSFIILMKKKHLGDFARKINQYGFLDLLDEKTKKDIRIFGEKSQKAQSNFENKNWKIDFDNTIYKKKDLVIDQDMMSIPYPIALNISEVIRKQYDYICNYIYFQISNKIFGVASVVFSFICLIIAQFNLTDRGRIVEYVNITCSFFSLVCVIIALYLSPVTRVNQYISSWKLLDSEMVRINSSIILYNDLSEKYKNNSKDAEVLHKIQEEANQIADALILAEAKLTSDGE